MISKARFFFYLKHPWRLLRRLLPKSFWGRSLLIVITPVFLIQIISGYVFFDRHWEQTTRLLANGIAGEISLGVALLDEAKTPAEQAKAIGLIQTITNIEVHQVPQQTISSKSRPFQSRFERALKRKISDPYKLQLTSDRVFVWIKKPSALFCFSFLKKRLFSHTTPLWLFWSLGASFFFAFLASLFMRRQIRPLQQLALVAEGLEEGKSIHTYHMRGATEIRRIGQMFFLMQRRLLEKMEEQSIFLAGISHDLRTPLTRIRLQLALMPPSPDLQELQTDVNQLIHMVEEYLEFIKQEERTTPETIVLKPFCILLLKCFDSLSRKIIVKIPPHLMINMVASDLRRCLQNLLENAFRYTKTSVWLSARKNGPMIEIFVDDDGPGIDPHLHQDVFKPFFRVAPDRNPETGGTGLGLTIVQKLIKKTGGNVFLTSSPMQGLRVVLCIPGTLPKISRQR